MEHELGIIRYPGIPDYIRMRASKRSVYLRNTLSGVWVITHRDNLDCFRDEMRGGLDSETQRSTCFELRTFVNKSSPVPPKEPEVKDMLTAIKITRRCNMRCKYCYVGDDHRNETISKDDLLLYISRLNEYNADLMKIVFIGGEPLLYPDLLSVAMRELEHVLDIYQVKINTNGTLLNSEICRLLKDYNCLLEVSLDGPEEVNDQNRGQFSKVMQGIEYLYNYKIPFTISCVVTQPNQIPASWQFFKSLQPYSVTFSRAAHQGRSGPMNDETDQSYQRDLIAVSREALTSDSVPRIDHLEVLKRQLFSGVDKAGYCLYNCRLGKYVAFSPEGAFYPCDRMSDLPELKLGVLREVKNLGDLMASSNVIDRLKALRLRHRLPKDECSTCEWADICRPFCTSTLYRRGEKPVHTFSCNAYRQLIGSLVDTFLEKADQHWESLTQT